MKKVLFLVLTFVFISAAGNHAKADPPTTKASYYHSKFNGRKTATGAVYSDHLKTAASNTYKLGTKLKVTNKKSGKSVEVVVNDRMAPGIKGRVDLSKAAFQQIASLDRGVVPVEIEVINNENGRNVM